MYGKEVNDFHTVDYEALSTLNISATQELHKIIKEQNNNIELLQKQINVLKLLLEKKGIVNERGIVLAETDKR